MKMFICVLILFLFSFSSFSQIDTEENTSVVKNLYPATKYGIIGGCSFNKLLTSNTSFDNIEFEREKFAMAGVFIEYPFPNSILSLRLEANYLKQAYSYHGKPIYRTSYSNYPPYTYFYTYADEIDLLMDLKTISIPVLVRVSDCSRKTGMFVDLGLVFNLNIQNEWHLYRTDSRDGGIYLDELIDSNLNADALVGYSLGFGVYNYFGKRRAYIEARTGRSTPLSDGDFNLSQNQVIAGFSF